MKYENNIYQLIELSEEISDQELNRLCQLIELLNKWDLLEDQTNTITSKEGIRNNVTRINCRVEKN